MDSKFYDHQSWAMPVRKTLTYTAKPIFWGVYCNEWIGCISHFNYKALISFHGDQLTEILIINGNALSIFFCCVFLIIWMREKSNNNWSNGEKNWTFIVHLLSLINNFDASIHIRTYAHTHSSFHFWQQSLIILIDERHPRLVCNHLYFLFFILSYIKLIIVIFMIYFFVFVPKELP